MPDVTEKLDSESQTAHAPIHHASRERKVWVHRIDDGTQLFYRELINKQAAIISPALATGVISGLLLSSPIIGIHTHSAAAWVCLVVGVDRWQAIYPGSTLGRFIGFR